MKTIKILLFAFTFAAAFLMTGCNEEKLLLYDGGNNVCFWARNVNHSLFGATYAELPKDTIVLRLNIMGFTAPYDRRVDAVAVEDAPGTADENRRTTATADQYNILGGVIPANSDTGYFYVEIRNVEQIREGSLKLRLALVENEYFGLGLLENERVNLTWSRELLRPQTWNAMRVFFCATYSTQVYKLIIQAMDGKKELWYYNAGPDPENNPEDIRVSAEVAYIYGRRFGDLVREYNAAHPGEPLLHDDGDQQGEPIIPLN